MAEKGTQVSVGSLDSKIQDISRHLKDNVLTPAEEERNKIINDAEKQREKIIADAEQNAEKIVSDAENKAQAAEENMQSSLRIAARQAVDRLKIAVEKKVLSDKAGKPVKQTLSDAETVKELVSRVIDHHLAGDSREQLSFVLPDNMREAVSALLAETVKNSAEDGIVIDSDTVPTGFKVVLRDGRLVYDFSAEAIRELLAQHMREDLRNYLFSD